MTTSTSLMPRRSIASAPLLPSSFRSFHTPLQRGRATGNDSLDEFGRRSEGWRDFAGVEHAKPSAAACADVKIAGHLCGATQQRARSCAPDRQSPRATLLRQIFLRRRKVSPTPCALIFQIFRARIALLGQRRRQVIDLVRSRLSSNLGPALHFRCQPGCAKFRARSNSPPAYRVAFFSKRRRNAWL